MLRRYARDTLSDDEALRLEVDGYRPYGFESINFAPERAEKLRSDVDVAFLQEVPLPPLSQPLCSSRRAAAKRSKHGLTCDECDGRTSRGI